MRKEIGKFLGHSLLAGALLTGASAYADADRSYRECGEQTHRMKHGDGRDRSTHMITRMTEQLSLDGEQLADVRAIVEGANSERQALKEKLHDNRRQLHELMNQDDLDETEVRELAQRQGAITADLMVLRAQMMHEIRSVLTPEQREQMQQMRGKHGRRKHS